MRLQHIHLPSLTPYPLASALQALLIQRHIDHHHRAPPPSSRQQPQEKKNNNSPPGSSDAVVVPPSLLTFTASPTYTTGRRQQHLSASQIQTLTHFRNPPPQPASAAYYPSARGGLLTFHGPGQLTAYPILHLRSHGLTPRCYVRALESALVATAQTFVSPNTNVRPFVRDEYPGVWVGSNEKLASVGVHVRRGVTGFGAGLNVSTDPGWWERGDACGIEGVKMVALAELDSILRIKFHAHKDGGVEAVGRILARELAAMLPGVDGVDDVGDTEKAALVEEARRNMAKDENEQQRKSSLS